VAAEVNDRGLRSAEVAHHLIDGHREFRMEGEVVAVIGHPDLALDRGALLVECKLARGAQVGVRRPGTEWCAWSTATSAVSVDGRLVRDEATGRVVSGKRCADPT
jgi:hypothetical protein